MDEIKKYMDEHGISYTSTDNKSDLLAKLGE
nr:MAG TPA: endoplasmic reticulum chaperone [Caudoviricetes sp.]